MVIQRSIEVYKGESLFRPEVPIFVNRAVETFDVIEHRHDFLEITYVAEGAGTHYIGDSALHVHQGDIFLIPIGVSHVFRPAAASPARPLIVYNCVMALESVLPLLQHFPGGDALASLLEQPVWRQYRDDHGDVRRLFLKLYDEYATMRPGWITGLHLAVLELLLHLHRDQEEPASSSRSIASTDMEAALYLIHTRFDSPITLREAADLASLGERQFHRKFKERTGMTFIDYVQSVRIDEACRLLRTTERKIADIASAVGYQDIGYFNKLFRTKTGLSPREYRQRIE
ncbi:helix-turn-helix domain-containing protein [Cohnella lubricantis]|uniref:AraC family transcriptional regulator n=1 Tax=Cohnella lubricantis TaxID=2163172 RepID=A0A841TD38_9BACL|nr:helix-turn-helix domain-containing protein [Cohnella lubricantis]MBB6676887.1 AraC family transcriptional regulator [Cohnella lubricantis]MBP2118287.1 AraC family L-rhamnose operon transcriptional activator RhaR [Cohnella lubricantis]